MGFDVQGEFLRAQRASHDCSSEDNPHGDNWIHPYGDATWVSVCRLARSMHFLPMRMTYSMDRLAENYPGGSETPQSASTPLSQTEIIGSLPHFKELAQSHGNPVEVRGQSESCAAS